MRVDMTLGEKERLVMKSLTQLRQKLFNNRFLALALLLSGLFLLAHLLGLREYTNILSGTGALTIGLMYGGMVYILLYVSVVGIVPICLIAGALRYGIRKIAIVFSGNSPHNMKGDLL
jgi:hypothetical protein